MKSLLTHATTCCVGIILGFFVFSSPQSHTNKNPHLQLVTETAELALRQKIADLTIDNKRLQSQLFALEKQQSENVLSQISSSEGSITPIEPVDEERKAKELAQHFEQFQKIQSLSNYLGSIEDESDSALYKNLEQNFSAEEVDYIWASDYENKIHQLIAEHDPFNALAYTSITCKTHRCQIKISASTAEEANQLTMAFAESISKNRAGVNPVQVLSATDLSSGFLDLYIAKDQHLNAFE